MISKHACNLTFPSLLCECNSELTVLQGCRTCLSPALWCALSFWDHRHLLGYLACWNIRSALYLLRASCIYWQVRHRTASW